MKPAKPIDYSQYGEQAVILAHTPPEGNLLDLGAFHPTKLSNSRALIERGYEAVLVDVNPWSVRELVREHGNNPKIQVIQAAVTHVRPAPGEPQRWATFNFTDDAVSTCDAGVHNLWAKAGGYYGKCEVPLIWVHDLPGIAWYYEFISIDLEGGSAYMFKELLPHADVDGVPPALRCICVEHDSRQAELKAFASERGWKCVLENSTNLVFAR